MNTGEHSTTPGDEYVHDDERSERNRALATLHNRLSDGLARARLAKTQLARRSGLGRTTVQQAFRLDGPVPSAETVVALAGVLKLPQEELLELRRTAAGSASRPVLQGGWEPGKPIVEWDPHDLEVHPAGPAPGHGPGPLRHRVLPGYVRRAHDDELAQAVRDVQVGQSRMVVLVGTSSTGKTRACWEAVQPLAELGWRLWHPVDPTRADAALDDLKRVQRQTVVWLNEAQHYLGDVQAGERIAAAVHALLTDDGRTPVLVLGTLWPEYQRQYTALLSPGKPDPHSRVRVLLAGRTLSVPDSFDKAALRVASSLAERGDRLLADALTRAHAQGRVTQDLAGAPELLHTYEYGTPPARALLEAAMDARRLGVGLHLPQTFLTDAAPDYLNDIDGDLAGDWAEAAFAELARPVHGRQASLRRMADRPARRPPGAPPPAAMPAGPAFQLADYLEQHGRITRRRLCPPASFWHSAYTHLTRPDDLANLAQAAEHRHRLQWAHHLRHRAAGAGHIGAVMLLAAMRERAGDWEGAEVLYQQAVDAGNARAVCRLVELREKAGDTEGAEVLARAAADAGDDGALFCLAEMRNAVGNIEGAMALYQQIIDIFSRQTTARSPDEPGAGKGTNCLARPADGAEHTDAPFRPAEVQQEAEDWKGATVPHSRADDAGALSLLAVRHEEAGDTERAEALARQAADAGNFIALLILAVRREKAGDGESAEALACHGADAGGTNALLLLAELREKAGDGESAEALARQAADAGHADGRLRYPAVIWGALHRADTRWPYGLDPDGTPASPWQ
ncbi:hypothetical protein A6P39_004840 [Streptomyces sp. FXJ1.172]|uniref:hypothetical protein n=1 Tax=Streptomyces sp. FXJ1.172 TaxID=710705 RepID=UPI000A5016CD|nr:hypothetical protein [Streptomyces sp. FXJ1.172]WEO93402.1 hypothetical protein A6P39_004840 [Streptomyces sp. FXJ1.172]